MIASVTVTNFIVVRDNVLIITLDTVCPGLIVSFVDIKKNKPMKSI